MLIIPGGRSFKEWANPGTLVLILTTKRSLTERSIESRIQNSIPHDQPNSKSVRLHGYESTIPEDRVGGRETTLKPAAVFLKKTTSETQQFQPGNLGMDLLRQTRWATLDFTDMSLTLR